MNTQRRFLVDVFMPDHSRGLEIDAEVLRWALGSEHVRVIRVPTLIYTNPIQHDTRFKGFKPEADIAVFIERIFDHELIQSYQRVGFIPNPEWMTNKERSHVNKIRPEIWHKTRFGMMTLKDHFPQSDHIYMGFTSPSSGQLIDANSSIAHFGGKSKTRHTQDIVNLWLQDENLPSLTLQAYQTGFSLPRWSLCGNLRVFLGFSSPEEYRAEFRRHGIHLCTSQTEGFGHYINEARSIGAVVIALDAPPMNELIDTESGILIPYGRSVRFNMGFRYIATSSAIRDGILKVISLSREQRLTLGGNAKRRYQKDALAFKQRLMEIVTSQQSQ